MKSETHFTMKSETHFKFAVNLKSESDSEAFPLHMKLVYDSKFTLHMKLVDDSTFLEMKLVYDSKFPLGIKLGLDLGFAWDLSDNSAS